MPAGCTQRLERARDELIERGFAPTADKDTARWLQVSNPSPDVVTLGLEMRTSADGPATMYVLSVYRPDGKARGPARWRVRRGPRCCDDHAAPEDHLFEQSWTRAINGFVAAVTVVEFEASMREPDLRRWREIFVELSRKAAEDCLAAPRR